MTNDSLFSLFLHGIVLTSRQGFHSVDHAAFRHIQNNRLFNFFLTISFTTNEFRLYMYLHYDNVWKFYSSYQVFFHFLLLYHFNKRTLFYYAFFSLKNFLCCLSRFNLMLRLETSPENLAVSKKSI